MAFDFQSYITGYVTFGSESEFLISMIPLITFAVLLVIYATFVWSFYKSISKRDLFKLNVATDHSIRTSIIYVLKYLITFPVLTFLWFAGLSVILFLLAKTQDTEMILMMSMALVAAARATAYYKEGIAEEISKLLPLGVLAMFIVDPSYFTTSTAISRFMEMQNLGYLLMEYLYFTVLLEFGLRIIFLSKRAIFDYMHPVVNKKINVIKKRKNSPKRIKK
jgi:hypothetical protein